MLKSSDSYRLPQKSEKLPKPTNVKLISYRYTTV